MINFYANAADAMGHGLIETVTRYHEAENQVSVVVTDHGPGMPEEVVMRIFDSGFTTKDTGTVLVWLFVAVSLKTTAPQSRLQARRAWARRLRWYFR